MKSKKLHIKITRTIRISFSIIILSCVSAISWSQEEVNVTYVANEGFLIRTENHKVLVDALFGGISGNWCEQPSDSVLMLMINGQPPFDSIDVVLISHYHVDHFNAKMISEFMVKNRNVTLVCPNQVNGILKKNSSYTLFSDRVKAISSADPHDTSLVVGGVQIRAMRINHGSYFEKDANTGEVKDRHKNVENIVYLIKADNYTLFHGGDASTQAIEKFKAYHLDIVKVDIGFFDRTFLRPEGMTIINDVVKPEKVVFMHIEPGRIDYYRNTVKDFQDMFIFSKPLETKIF